MVEAQAAARVDRLGQTKNIVIIRYIVERSIEEVYFHIWVWRAVLVLRLNFIVSENSSPAEKEDAERRILRFPNVEW